MKTWWLLLMSRSRRDSATTGLGNSGYQSAGARLDVRTSDFPALSVMSSYRSSAWAAVSSLIAKSSRTRTAGRVSSASRLSQVRSACPPARWASALLVFMNRASAPARMASGAMAWAMWLVPTPAGQGHGVAAGDLVLAQDLQEVQVAEFPGVGLGEAGVQGVQHAGQFQVPQ